MKTNAESIFNVVVGTAGHIDHGKSALVAQLTGVHPDRLPEEKERGLTIDLGFAPLTLASGLRVGVIDVPGHERLVKNMVAGATGIDLVILVVAADDGVMPQTEEHVAIMELLGLKHGIVAITKIDTVETDLRELVREDIQTSLSGSFLRDAPIVEVSSVTGEGIEELRALLNDELSRVKPRDTSGVFRMPVQRVFSARGFGTIVTGVPVQGETTIGATLEVSPLGAKGRVRGIHAYREATDKARAGHSAAINLTDVDYKQVRRGMVVAEPGYARSATMFEARLSYLLSCSRPLRHQAPIRLHVGTAEALGRVFLLERKEVQPGEETFVQFRLDEPVVAAGGDRFVLRSYSPAATIGGGEIVSHSRWRLKTGKQYVLTQLEEKASSVGDPRRSLLNLLKNSGLNCLTPKEISLSLGLLPGDVAELIKALIDSGEVRRSGRGDGHYSVEQMRLAAKKVTDHAASFFREHPRRLLLDKLHLRQALGASDAFLLDLLGFMTSAETLEEPTPGKLRFRGLEPQLSDEEAEIKAELAEAIAAGKFSPPDTQEIATARRWNVRVAEELAQLLEDEGELVRVGGGLLFHRRAIEAAKTALAEHLNEHGPMTAAEAKAVLQSTRKYCIPLLEYLDDVGFTARSGDTRHLRAPADTNNGAES